MNSPAAFEVIPTVAGTPFAGGLYVDRMFVAGQLFALVSTGADGELEEQPWSASRKRVDGALSYNDGLANTEAMAAEGSELAKAARASRVNGLDDWYLPSPLEAFLQQRALAPKVADGEDAFARDWYWTSGQHESASAFAWYQSFGWGNQNYFHKSNQFRARLVRRVAI